MGSLYVCVSSLVYSKGCTFRNHAMCPEIGHLLRRKHLVFLEDLQDAYFDHNVRYPMIPNWICWFTDKRLLCRVVSWSTLQTFCYRSDTHVQVNCTTNIACEWMLDYGGCEKLEPQHVWNFFSGRGDCQDGWDMLGHTEPKIYYDGALILSRLWVLMTRWDLK